MSQQFICDECGEPIDLTQPHYQLTGSKVRVTEDGVLTAIDPARTLHYHEEHVPGYKIEGNPVDAAGHPIDPPHPDQTLPGDLNEDDDPPAP